MKLHTYNDPSLFLDQASPFLLQNEPENNLLLGLAAGAVGVSAPEITPWFAFLTEGEDPSSPGVVCAWQTVPAKVGITRTSAKEASALLASVLEERLTGEERLLGPEPDVRVVIEIIAGSRGVGWERSMAQRLHLLRQVSEGLPERSGELRPAVAEDRSVVARFIRDFFLDAEGVEAPEGTATRKLDAGQIYLWVDEGEVRSMAAWDGATPNGVRINYVYTPPEHRGAGYATACVAELTRLMLRQGRGHCALYTDLANPISNSIYRKIGYRGLCDFGVYRLKGEGA